MKPSHRSFHPLAPLLLAAALHLCGCAVIGSPPRTVPSATFQGVEDDYRLAQRQTAATEAALNGVAVTADLDLQQSFDYFSANRALLEQIGVRLMTHADGMFYRGIFYFVEAGSSPSSCVFPSVGGTSGLSSIDLGEEFTPLAEAGGAVKRSFRAFQFDIEQIQDCLATNMTPSALDTIAPLLRKAKVDSDALQQTLGEAVTVLEQAKGTLPGRRDKKG